ncbi:MAG: glycogen debranching protein GlgX [Thermomicrobiales bacterium]
MTDSIRGKNTMTTNPSTPGIRPGFARPLGATLTCDGTNFAIFSQHSEKVELCLFEDESGTPSRTFELPERTHYIWHVMIPGVASGTRYGYRIHGPYEPDLGHRFNPAKLLVDPYAKALEGEVIWSDETYPYDLSDPDDDYAIDSRANDQFMPKSVVIDSSFDWQGDTPPNTSLLESIIYEVHVKGFTQLHPEIPEEIRGTYAGMAHPVVIDHLRGLGVTAVELLPVHSFVDDHFLTQKNLRNYWGYSTLGFFAPDARYASNRESGAQVNEFKEMVRSFHAAGIEVIIDVVFNHTCEGNHLGPMLSFKGVDNLNYYRLLPGRSRYYMDFTGTGNTFNPTHPQVLTMITDSLRYWVTEMHVDGFRFDLAPAVAREIYDVDRNGGFFDSIHQDPVLSQVKLIAEPWDIGENGYQVGNFPVLWSEWNDKFRDGVRLFWQTKEPTNADMGYRLTGSSDLYEGTGRGPVASVNFLTSHDGFCLNDLVSYVDKHNEANGENGADGHDHNINANYGAEGPTDDPHILDLRRRQSRNMLATLMLSQGVPMLLGGDEMGRTQQGNNNAYCQDNDISWFNWNLDQNDRDLIAFVSRLTEIRRQQPILRRRRFFRGQPMNPRGFKDLSWIKADGNEFNDNDWTDPALLTLGLRMPGDSIEEMDENGDPIETSTLFMILNRGEEEISFVLPLVDRRTGTDQWDLVLSTDSPTGQASQKYGENSTIQVPGRTVLLFEGIDRDFADASDSPELEQETVE